MSPTTKFIVFSLLGVVSLAAGYLGRRRGLLRESYARPIHYFVLVYCWSGAYLIGNWNLPMRIESAWAAAMMMIAICTPGFIIAPLARWWKIAPQQVGVLIAGASIGNTGFTLGAYLCYLMIRPQDASLGFASTYAAVNTYALVLVVYPLILHYAHAAGQEQTQTIGKVVWRSLTGMPALPMYASLGGWALAAASVPQPAFIGQLHLVEVFTYLLVVGSYLGIGLTLRIGDAGLYAKSHTLMAVFVYGFTPLLMLAMIALTHLTPRPVDPVATKVLIVESLMPAGVSTVLVANVFHLDARMAGNVWLWNTLAFLLLILPIIWWVIS